MLHFVAHELVNAAIFEIEATDERDLMTQLLAAVLNNNTTGAWNKEVEGVSYDTHFEADTDEYERAKVITKDIPMSHLAKILELSYDDNFINLYSLDDHVSVNFDTDTGNLVSSESEHDNRIKEVDEVVKLARQFQFRGDDKELKQFALNC